MVKSYNESIKYDKQPRKQKPLLYSVLENLIWVGTNPKCPFCGRDSHEQKDGVSWKCTNRFCRRVFKVTYNTVFKGSKLSLGTWVRILDCIYVYGFNSTKLSTEIGITQPSAWKIIQKIKTSSFGEIVSINSISEEKRKQVLYNLKLLIKKIEYAKECERSKRQTFFRN